MESATSGGSGADRENTSLDTQGPTSGGILSKCSTAFQGLKNAFTGLENLLPTDISIMPLKPS
jgi:hypothetical protein